MGNKSGKASITEPVATAPADNAAVVETTGENDTNTTSPAKPEVNNKKVSKKDSKKEKKEKKEKKPKKESKKDKSKKDTKGDANGTPVVEGGEADKENQEVSKYFKKLKFHLIWYYMEGNSTNSIVGLILNFVWWKYSSIVQCPTFIA